MRNIFYTALITALISLSVNSAAHALCVSASEANLRSGPGTNHEKLWEVFKYMPLKRLGKKGVWYKVSDVDGDTYWVYGPLITSKYKCAVVKDEKANVRTGPGTNYKQTSFSPALKYYSFRVLKIQGKWVRVQDEYGDKGWIYKPLLWIQ
jgi:SH3-like domain-containing protein